MSAIRDDAAREAAIKAFRKPARPIDGEINSRTRAAAAVAATLGTEFLSTAEREHLAAVKADPSLITGPATAPSQGRAGAPKQSVEDYLASMPPALRDKIWETMLASGEYIVPTAENNSSGWEFADIDDSDWNEE
jgi:hypothetical protein